METQTNARNLLYNFFQQNIHYSYKSQPEQLFKPAIDTVNRHLGGLLNLLLF